MMHAEDHSTAAAAAAAAAKEMNDYSAVQMENMDSCYSGVVKDVSESWSRLKRSRPDMDVEFGSILILRMYQIAPTVAHVFPWKISEIERKSPKFVVFAQRFTRMLDASIDMLGPEMEIVEEQLSDLGASHALMGITEFHYEVFQQALDYTLGEILKTDYTTNMRNSWTAISQFMICCMEDGATRPLLRP